MCSRASLEIANRCGSSCSLYLTDLFELSKGFFQGRYGKQMIRYKSPSLLNLLQRKKDVNIEMLSLKGLHNICMEISRNECYSLH